jgi:hypothetical protein
MSRLFQRWTRNATGRMEPYAKAALWAAIITTVSAVVQLSGAPQWLGPLALPSFPGYLVAFFFDLGSNTEGIPGPTNIAVHLVTFVVWWGGIYYAIEGRKP